MPSPHPKKPTHKLSPECIRAVDILCTNVCNENIPLLDASLLEDTKMNTGFFKIILGAEFKIPIHCADSSWCQSGYITFSRATSTNSNSLFIKLKKLSPKKKTYTGKRILSCKSWIYEITNLDCISDLPRVFYAIWCERGPDLDCSRASHKRIKVQSKKTLSHPFAIQNSNYEEFYQATYQVKSKPMTTRTNELTLPENVMFRSDTLYDILDESSHPFENIDFITAESTEIDGSLIGKKRKKPEFSLDLSLFENDLKKIAGCGNLMCTCDSEFL